MKRLAGFLCTLALGAGSAPAAVITVGTIEGNAGDSALVDLPMLDGPGSYYGSVSFSRPGSIYLEYRVEWVYNFFCDFGEGFVNCGGDESTIGFDMQTPYGKALRIVYSIPPAYRIDYSPIFYETGMYFARGARFDYAFLVDGAVEYRAITDAVPESQTWMTLVGGFGLIGAATRRGRRVAASRRCSQ